MVSWGSIASVASPIIGGIFGDKKQEKGYSREKEFAQNSIQWKVKDAKAAGIHPLAALGVPTMSTTGQNTGSDHTWLANLGQNISGHIDRNQNKKERALKLRVIEAQLRGQEIDNMIAARKLTTAAGNNTPKTPPQPDVNSDGTPISTNVPGATLTPIYKTEPKEPTATKKGAASPGASPALQVVNMPSGGKTIFLGEKLREQFEDGITAEVWKTLFDVSKLIASRPPAAVRKFGKPGYDWYKRITALGTVWFNLPMKTKRSRKPISSKHYNAVRRGPEFKNNMFK